MKLNGRSEKLQLEYPCEWTYKVIGRQPEILEEIVRALMQERSYEMALSNKSKTQKYYSMNLVTEVKSEEDRNTIYQQLKNHPEIVMVL